MQFHGGKGEIIVQLAVIEAAADDVPAQGVQLVGVELDNLLLEEVGENADDR